MRQLSNEELNESYIPESIIENFIPGRDIEDIIKELNEKELEKLIEQEIIDHEKKYGAFEA